MIRALLIAFTGLFFSVVSYAQDEQHTTDVSTLNFFAPGVGYEKAISKNSTLYGSAYLNFSFYYRYSSAFGDETHFSVNPGFTLQYRHYYNFYGREERGRRTEMNSANYIAPVLYVVYSKDRVANSDLNEADRRPITTLGAVWGMQRNYRKRFSLNLNLGVGYYFAKGTVLTGSGNQIKVNRQDWTTLGSLNLGFWINKRK